jgi:hypothetical protein
VPNLEESTEWEAIRTAADQRPLPEVAASFGITAGSLAAALKRTQSNRTAIQSAINGESTASSEGRDPDREDRAGLPPEPSGSSRGRAGERRSRLDQFRDLIGRMPDAAVAARVGMSLQAVRNYRQKHGIRAAGRRRTPEEVAAAASSPGESSASGRWAWRVQIQQGGDTICRIALGNSIAELLQRLEGRGEVIGLERIGEAM